MPVNETPVTCVRIAKTQDVTVQIRVRSHEWAQLTAAAIAGATALSVRPLEYALASGAKLLFGGNVVTLSASAAAGDVSLAVTAISGPLKAGDEGQLLRDLTGYSIEMEVLSNRGDATPIISLSGSAVTLATQSGVDRGKVDIALVAANTTNVAAGMYYWAAWRRNSGSTRPLAEGDFELVEKGFL
jgi:hypothetical protein